MTKSTPDPRVDDFVDGAESWQAEIRALRALLLDSGLAESLKWRKPCYSLDGANVAIVQPFKNFCALLFFKGALLKDTHGLLRSQGKNTRSAMRLEFSSEDQIHCAEVMSYVRQAIEVERQGLRVEPRASSALELPDELEQALRRDDELARAFHQLTPGRQRGYALHISGAKQSKTRVARIERVAPRILEGKGMHDR